MRSPIVFPYPGAAAAPPPSAGGRFRVAAWLALRSSLRAGSRRPDPDPESTVPMGADVGALDAVRSAFWHAFRHLFPPHALPIQSQAGHLVISWSTVGDPQAPYRHAAPIVLRFEPELVTAMLHANAVQRRLMAMAREPALRDGLQGYDPYCPLPSARFIVIG